MKAAKAAKTSRSSCVGVAMSSSVVGGGGGETWLTRMMSWLGASAGAVDIVGGGATLKGGIYNADATPPVRHPGGKRHGGGHQQQRDARRNSL